MWTNKGSVKGGIDLTDSGLRVKTRKEAHMKTPLNKPARNEASYTELKSYYHQRLRRLTSVDKQEAARLLSKCQKI